MTNRQGAIRQPKKPAVIHKRKPRVEFTPEVKALFLETLMESGNVSASAKVADVDRHACYYHRADDPLFAAAWDEAMDISVDSLESEARRRGVQGVEKPVYQGGKEVGVIREFSDTLLIFLLKGARPDKYKERVEINEAKVRGMLDNSILPELLAIVQEESEPAAYERILVRCRQKAEAGRSG